MPPRDPTQIQLDFPELVADIIGQLSLLGQVGLLGFSPEVVPVYIAAARGGSLAVTAGNPIVTDAGLASSNDLGPGLNAVLADTGQLVEGVHDFTVGIEFANDAVAGFVFLQHRDAANLVTLSQIPLPRVNAQPHGTAMPISFAMRMQTNERVRWQIDAASTGTSRWGSYIMSTLRPSP